MAVEALLSVNNIEVVYNKTVQVLRGLSLKVDKGAVVALLGSNGAGKSTTLKAISNLLDLEDGKVTISRVSGAVTYPAEFMLVCAMNPCKCGWYGDPSGRCRCSQRDVENYRSRISGPLLDRIDIVVEVPSVHFEDLRERAEAEPSASVKPGI